MKFRYYIVVILAILLMCISGVALAGNITDTETIPDMPGIEETVFVTAYTDGDPYDIEWQLPEAADFLDVDYDYDSVTLEIDFNTYGKHTVTFIEGDGSKTDVSTIVYAYNHEVYSGGFTTDYVKRSTEYNDVGVTIYTGVEAEMLWVQDYVGDFGGFFNKTVTKVTEDNGLLRWDFKLTFLTGEFTRYFFGVDEDFNFSTNYVYDTVTIAEQNVDTYSAAFTSDHFEIGKTATAVVYTGPDADRISMYSDTGSLLNTWYASSAKPTEAKLPDGIMGLRWTVKHTFAGEGSRTLKFVSSNSSLSGDAVNTKLLITSGGDIAVSSVKFGSQYYVKGKAATITVKTGADAKYLKMYSETGALANTWKAETYSKIEGNIRIWTLKKTFTGAGARTMNFRTSKDNVTLSAGKKASVLITSGNDINVASAAFASDTAIKGKTVSITVKTGADAKYLKMYTSAGSCAKTWNASGNSKISGSYRVWTVSHAFSGVGSRTMTFKASKDNKAVSVGKSDTIVISSGSDYGITSAAFGVSAVKKGTAVTITVKTGLDAAYLKMYAESGSCVKTWGVAYSKISGTERIWTVTHSFSGAGVRTMTFRASKDNGTFSMGKSATVTITTGSDINAKSAAVSTKHIVKGNSVTFTVKTGADAKYLGMFVESGSRAKLLSAATYSKLDGGTRVWTYKHTFTGAGYRTLTFKGSVDGKNFGTGKSVSLLVSSGSDVAVTSASFAKDSVVKGNAISITVKTGADAQYLAMYAENGSRIKLWKASESSAISGNARVWTVKYTFSGAGTRTMTFKASKDNSTFGKAKTDTINVTAK